ncbi:hypothetical protein NFJ07_23955, partial [Arthrobacter sp. B2a2-09]|uniref:hypothetical protein n=1 Tax=Arthrobacter sp. B2a2-09 TaxID=2952822 RepID=UPI0022CD6999
ARFTHPRFANNLTLKVMCHLLDIGWLVPTFELIPAGHKSKSQWALGVVGTIAVSLIASGLYSLLVPPPK